MARLGMSIGKRLVIGFGVVLCLLLIVAGTSMYGSQRQWEATRYLVEQIMPRADAAADLETAFLLQSTGARSYILSGDERYLADYRRGVDQARQAFSKLDALPMTAEGAAILAEMRPLAANFTDRTNQGIALRQQGRSEEASQLILTEMAPARDALLQRSDAFFALQVRLKNDARAQVNGSRADTERTSLFISALALLAASIFAYTTARAVREPILGLVGSTSQLAAGDYASVIESAGQVAGDGADASCDEVRVLAHRFRSAARDLLVREAHLSAQARLSSILATTTDAGKLAAEALREVCAYAKAELGAVYTLQERDELCRIASFSLNGDAPVSLRLGEGIVGEAALSRKTVMVRNIPADIPFRLNLGVDEIPPRWVVAVPLVGRGELVGTILLGGLNGPDKMTMDYVEQVDKLLAVSLQNAIAHRRIEWLVNDLQNRNERLSAQAEEIQAQNEEIRAQAEEIQTQNEELMTQNEELEAQTEELAEQNQRVAQQSERLSLLQSITVRLSNSLAPEDVLEQILMAVVDLTGSSLASVFLLDDSAESLHVAASIGFDESGSGRLCMTRNQSVAGRALAEGRTIVVEDASSECGVQFPLLAGKRPVGSIVVAPMIVRGEELGVVEVYFDERRSLPTADVEMMSALGAAAGVAVYNSRLFETAIQQTKLAEDAVKVRDEFISVAAHELKTPVTSLQGFAQLVRRQLEKSGTIDAERLSVAMSRIDQQSRRLTRLTEHLLNLSRLQTGSFVLSREDTDLQELVDRVLMDLKQIHPEREFDVRGELRGVACVDPLRIEQLISNLLDNSVKFSPEESRIDVELDSSQPGWARISVRDRGIGIPEDERERIFERFYQAHSDGHFGGMGIGLFVARQIVEMHGGSIAVEQPEDGGSRFVVTLPLASRGDGSNFG